MCMLRINFVESSIPKDELPGHRYRWIADQKLIYHLG